jgi:hypothetical protein
MFVVPTSRSDSSAGAGAMTRADPVSSHASLRFLSASRLIAGKSRFTTTRSQAVAPRPVGLCIGGEMLFKAAFALLATWLLGRLLDTFGVYRVGDLVHVFLLVGLMLLLLAMLKARDAALRPPNPPAED